MRLAFLHSESELSRVTDRQTDWRTDTAHIGNNSLHLMHCVRSMQPNNTREKSSSQVMLKSRYTFNISRIDAGRVVFFDSIVWNSNEWETTNTRQISRHKYCWSFVEQQSSVASTDRCQLINAIKQTKTNEDWCGWAYAYDFILVMNYQRPAKDCLQGGRSGPIVAF